MATTSSTSSATSGANPRIYRGPDPWIADFPRTSLFSYLLPADNQYAAEPAFIDAPSGRVLTRADVRHMSTVIAHGLRLELPLNVSKGATILFFSGNSLAMPLAVLGTLAAGIKFSMASSSLTAPELAYQIKDSEPTHLFVAPELVPIAIAALESLGVKPYDIQRRLLLLAFRKDVSQDLYDRGFMDVDYIMRVDKELFPEKFEGAKADETVMLFYSSGTTGLPKGVELTHYNLVSVNALMAGCRVSAAKPGEQPYELPTLGVMPHYHVYGGVMLIFFPLVRRSPSIIMPRFEPQAYLETIQKYRPTYLYIAPPVAAFLANSPLVDSYDLSSVRSVTSSAASLSPSIAHAMKAKLEKRGATNLHVAQGFGATEMSPTILMTPHGEGHKPASSGILVPNVEARIVDENGIDVEDGKPGELLVRGPNMMKGYYKKPESTRNTIKDGWLYTGDIVTRDSEGSFFIIDRIKELIKYNGLQISPVEVEQVIVTHPKILDCAVVGVRDPKTGNELPRAYVVLRDPKKDERSIAAELKDYVKERVSHYKQLRGGVVPIDAIPKSLAGKVLRRELRTLAEQEVKAKL